MNAIQVQHDDSADDTHLIPTDGTINRKEVMKALFDIGCKGHLTLEVVYPEDDFATKFF